MTSVNRITKFLWILSLLGFLALDLYSYAQLPQSVGYIYSQDGLPTNFIERPFFFFIGIGFIIILNLIIVSLMKTFVEFPFKQLGWEKLAVWQTTRAFKLSFVEFIETWGYSFLIFLNLFLSYTLYVLWKVNSEMGSRISEYSWIIWPFALLMVVFPLYLVAKLATSKPE